jgi:hypothetical protein
MDCPYCGEEVDAPGECHNPDIAYQNECSHCDKTFVFYVEYYPSYTEIKAPCLNGGDHDYQPIVGFPVEYFANKRRCSYCAEEITVSGLTTTPTDGAASCPKCGGKLSPSGCVQCGFVPETPRS